MFFNENNVSKLKPQCFKRDQSYVFCPLYISKDIYSCHIKWLRPKFISNINYYARRLIYIKQNAYTICSKDISQYICVTSFITHWKLKFYAFQWKTKQTHVIPVISSTGLPENIIGLPNYSKNDLIKMWFFTQEPLLKCKKTWPRRNVKAIVSVHAFCIFDSLLIFLFWKEKERVLSKKAKPLYILLFDLWLFAWIYTWSLRRT